jgi:hypothetical protein
VRDDIYERAEKRIDAIYEAFTADLSWLVRRYLGLGWWQMKPQLIEKLHKAIEDGLRKKGLY